jgi:hypothetical protein
VVNVLSCFHLSFPDFIMIAGSHDRWGCSYAYDEAPITPSAPPLVPTAAAASADPYAEARERMRLLKAQPVPVKPPPRFVYSEEDAIKPLVMMPKK